MTARYILGEVSFQRPDLDFTVFSWAFKSLFQPPNYFITLDEFYSHCQKGRAAFLSYFTPTEPPKPFAGIIGFPTDEIYTTIHAHLPRFFYKKATWRGLLYGIQLCSLGRPMKLYAYHEHRPIRAVILYLGGELATEQEGPDGMLTYILTQDKLSHAINRSNLDETIITRIKPIWRKLLEEERDVSADSVQDS